MKFSEVMATMEALMQMAHRATTMANSLIVEARETENPDDAVTLILGHLDDIDERMRLVDDQLEEIENMN